MLEIVFYKYYRNRRDGRVIRVLKLLSLTSLGATVRHRSTNGRVYSGVIVPSVVSGPTIEALTFQKNAASLNKEICRGVSEFPRYNFGLGDSPRSNVIFNKYCSPNQVGLVLTGF